MTSDGAFLAMKIGYPYYGVECRSCKHRAVFPTLDLVRFANVPGDARVSDVLDKMRCSICGHKGAEGKGLKDARWANGWRRAARG